MGDINKNGDLSLMELARALCAFNMWLGKRTQCPIAPDSMLMGISLDTHLSKPVHMSDKEWKEHLALKEKLLELLKKFDLDGDSQFSLQEMANALVSLGWGAEEANSSVKGMDRNNDSIVTVNEFLAWIYTGDVDSKR